MPVNPIMFRAAVRAAKARRAALGIPPPVLSPLDPSPPPTPMDNFLLNLALPVWLAIVLFLQMFGLVFRLAIRPYLIILQLRNEGVLTGPFRAFVGQRREEAELRKDWSNRTSTTTTDNTESECQRVLRMPPDFFGQHHVPVYATTLGSTVRISLSDPSITQEAFAADGTLLTKAKAPNNVCALFGRGLLASNRALWAHQRQHVSRSLLTSTFLKRSLRTAGEWANLRLDAWADPPTTAPSSSASASASSPSSSTTPREVDVSKQYAAIAFQTAVHSAFGSPRALPPALAESLFAGCEAYRDALTQASVEEATSSSIFRRISSTGARRAIKREANKVRDIVFDHVVERRKAIIAAKSPEEDGNEGVAAPPEEVDEEDFLGVFLGGENLRMTTRQIADECTTILFAGYDKTSQLLTWTTLLLAVQPKWQEAAREEAIAVCGPSDRLTWEGLPRLKVIESILFETLRLFPAVPTLVRQCDKDMKVRDFTVTRECEVSIPIAHMQRSKEIWGPSAADFALERFMNSVSDVTKKPPPTTPVGESEIAEAEPAGDDRNPTVEAAPGNINEGQPSTSGLGCTEFLSFGVGKRACPGRALALVEAKAVIVALLQRYTLRLAPGYRHEPVATPATALKPLYGMPILVERVEGAAEVS